MKVNLHVDRLVLDGIEATSHQRSVLRSAFVSELSRLVELNGLNVSLSRGVSLPVVPAGQIQLGTRFEARETGVRIARAVYEGLGPSGTGA